MIKGAVAAGNPLTAQAAQDVLELGGNAFDAAIASVLAASVTEPVLSSLGGGGYLLARSASGQHRLYDFFVQTPLDKHQDIDFHPICANFGTATQTFHIGYGSMAVPGVVKGLFTVHRELGKLPMSALIEPAMVYARSGIPMDNFQAYVFDVIKPILLADKSAASLYCHADGELLQNGDRFHNPAYADFLYTLDKEGERFFYEGEIAESVASLCRQHRGLLTKNDFSRYRVIERQPLEVFYRGHRLTTNPPPSSGGPLICFALKLLEKLNTPLNRLSREQYILHLAGAMQQTAYMRQQSPQLLHHPGLLDDEHINRYMQGIDWSHHVSRGTTHITVMDADGNIASFSISNGEGCGHLIPGTGIMLNNMLGEEDLNPDGFHQWQPDTRMTSMLAPTIVDFEDTVYAMGSGGSNRLRTAILQVILQLIDFNMPLEQAVENPRIHFDHGVLHLEGGHPNSLPAFLKQQFPQIETWQDLNLFFGGTHVVGRRQNVFLVKGDPRRGGTGLIV